MRMSRSFSQGPYDWPHAPGDQILRLNIPEKLVRHTALKRTVRDKYPPINLEW